MLKHLIVLFGIILGVCPSIVIASEIAENRTYPRFMIGSSGVEVTIEPGRRVTIAATDKATIIDGDIHKGDVIVAANDRAIEGIDPRVPLGQALTEAEANSGKLILRLSRNDVLHEATVQVPVLGSYSPTWPMNCRKSRGIIEQTAKRLVKAQQSNGWYQLDGQTMDSGLTGCMATLFLLSTGDDAYMPTVERFVLAVARLAEQAREGASAWHSGYQGILLAEYFLRTGDERVLAGLQRLCAIAAAGQVAGSWGHSLENTINAGYVQSGQMNSAGVTVFLMLALARECGVTVSEEAFERSLVFFWRMVGHGSVCYGDHRAEIYADTNGRNAALACALAVINAEPYRQGAAHLAMMVAESYYGHELGHTGGGFNVIWRGIGIMHLSRERQVLYRQHMDQLTWYYDLCRRADGSFRILPSPGGETRYTGEDWGYAVALTYTAPRRTLRITGAAPTRHSVRTPTLPHMLWGTPRDLEFLSTNHASDFGRDEEPPHIAYERLNSNTAQPVSYYAKMMRHANPVIRTWAAGRIAQLNKDDAYRAIAQALAHRDVRVRRAACDAISAYRNWGAAVRRPMPPAVVSQQFMPHLSRILRDGQAAWWEVDGALWALANALPDDIRSHYAVIRQYAAHDEWYLRESSYFALMGVGRVMTGEEFRFLADMYLKSRHVYERSSYDGGLQWLLGRERPKLPDDAIAAFVRNLGRMTHTVLIAAGYDTRTAGHEAAHRVMMSLNRFESPPYRLIVPDFVKYLQDWTPDYQHSHWLIVGSKWQPGLVKIAEELGPDARPLIEAFEKCLSRVQWNERSKEHRECRQAMEQAVTAFRYQYGRAK